MPGQTPTFNQIQGDETIEQLRDEVARMQKTMNHLLRHLSSKNVKEVGGYFITPTDILSKDGDVGMSSVNPDEVNLDPVRFFAGGVDIANAPWRVHNSGKMVATGAIIQSKDGFPKVVMDPATDLFGAYSDEDTYILMDAFYPTTNKPAIVFMDGVLEMGNISASSSKFILSGFQQLDIICSAGPIVISSDNGSGVRFDDWSQLINVATNRTLQQDLDAKATKGVATSSAGAQTLNGGIPIGTQLMVNGGGTVTWNGINVSSHTHTQN